MQLQLSNSNSVNKFHL